MKIFKVLITKNYKIKDIKGGQINFFFFLFSIIFLFKNPDININKFIYFIKLLKNNFLY